MKKKFYPHTAQTANRNFSLLLFLLVFSQTALAQLSLENGTNTYLIDFGSTVAGVNNGPFDGTGFTPSPAVGQLDGDGWEVTGFDGGTHPFGGTSITGDFAWGSSSGGETTGGIYAFNVGGGNMALGIQPGGSDFTPGDFTLKITNNRTAEINAIIVSYTVWVLNDQDRSNSFNFSHSPDHSSYTLESGLDFTSPETADGSPTWASHQRNIQLDGLSIAGSGGNFYLRWTGDDVSGGGSRDEFALDDISVTVLPICPTGDIILATQVDVNNFPTNYPGCTSTDYSISIGGTATDISNLNALSALTHIGGNLQVFSTSSLENLNGLHNLLTVGGNL